MKIRNSELIKHYALVLEAMHNEYKNTGEIKSLSVYVNEYVTLTFLRRLPDAGIVVPTTNSKRYMRYKWNADVDKEWGYEYLADKLLSMKSSSSSEYETSDNVTRPTHINNELSSMSASKATVILMKEGVDPDRIPELIMELYKIFKE